MIHDRRGLAAVLGCAGVLTLAVASVVAAVWLAASRPAPVRPPELGGQAVPARRLAIEFDRRYDLHCQWPGEERTVFSGCKILGFTGEPEKSAGLGELSGSVEYGRWTERWLVLERDDGRKLYLPPNCIRYIEEAAPGEHAVGR